MLTLDLQVHISIVFIFQRPRCNSSDKKAPTDPSRQEQYGGYVHVDSTGDLCQELRSTVSDSRLSEGLHSGILL